MLANCAGFAIAREFDEMEMVDFERILRVNTLGSAYVTRALLPGMKAAGGGRVLFTSSMAGQVCSLLSLSLSLSLFVSKSSPLLLFARQTFTCSIILVE